MRTAKSGQKAEYRFKTIELAVLLLKAFGRERQEEPFLSAMTCLLIASKLEEKYFLSFAHCQVILEHFVELKVGEEEVRRREELILKTLQFRLTLSTPQDLAQGLLFLADPEQDWSAFYAQLQNYTSLILIDPDLARCSAYAQAISGILAAVEHQKFRTFKRQFLNLILKELSFVDFDEVYSCKLQLTANLKQQQEALDLGEAELATLALMDAEDKATGQLLLEHQFSKLLTLQTQSCVEHTLSTMESLNPSPKGF